MVFDLATQRLLEDKQLFLRLNGSSTTTFQSVPRVAFALDKQGNPREEHIDAGYELTDDLESEIWWSKQELNEISEEARAVITAVRRNPESTSFTSDFIQLFTMCAEKKATRLRDHTLLDHQEWRTSRGLERHVHDVLPRYKRNFLQIMLDTQQRLPKEMEPEMQERLLSAKSCQLSKPSRHLARLVAHQDCLDVAEMILEEQGRTGGGKRSSHNKKKGQHHHNNVRR